MTLRVHKWDYELNSEIQPDVEVDDVFVDLEDCLNVLTVFTVSEVMWIRMVRISLHADLDPYRIRFRIQGEKSARKKTLFNTGTCFT